MIPAHLINDFSAAWKEGGTRAYSYIWHLWDFACKARDYELAATADWLEDVLNERTAIEVMNDERIAALCNAS